MIVVSLLRYYFFLLSWMLLQYCKSLIIVMHIKVIVVAVVIRYDGKPDEFAVWLYN